MAGAGARPPKNADKGELPKQPTTTLISSSYPNDGIFTAAGIGLAGNIYENIQNSLNMNVMKPGVLHCSNIFTLDQRQSSGGSMYFRRLIRFASCWLLSLTCLSLAAPANALEGAVSPAPVVQGSGPTQVAAGAYILRVSNVSQKDGTFDVDMWVWMRWKGAGLEPQKTFEIANGVINSRSDTAILDDKGYKYSTIRVQATLFHQFDVKRFPLDNHRITIEFEDSTYDASTLRYVADRGTALDPNLTVPGWKAKLEQPLVSQHVYPTDYGLRSSATPTAIYSRLVLAIDLERNSMMVLLKEFWISILAVALSLLALLVHSHDLDARFGLGVGSIFAASANAYVLSDNLPQTTAVTLAEQLNLLAVGTIFVTVFVSIWSLRLRYADRVAASLKLDNAALIFISAAYVIVNGLLLFA